MIHASPDKFSLTILMVTTTICLTACLLSVAFDPACAADPAPLAKELEPFRPFIGKTWKGTGPGQEPGSTMTDVARWERALNGQAIRTLHSVNDGTYGGESLIFWDRETKSLTFYYFTTAGFYTHGTMTFDGAKCVGREVVSGNENGITEVRSTTEILPDGKMKTTSEYLQKDKWVPGHSFLYAEDPAAQVVFK